MSPPHIETRYLRGGCVAFAVALHQELKLPVYVLADLHNGDEDWIHAFAADEKQGFALDVRGVMQLDAMVVARGAHIRGVPLILRASKGHFVPHGSPSDRDRDRSGPRCSQEVRPAGL